MSRLFPKLKPKPTAVQQQVSVLVALCGERVGERTDGED